MDRLVGQVRVPGPARARAAARSAGPAGLKRLAASPRCRCGHGMTRPRPASAGSRSAWPRFRRRTHGRSTSAGLRPALGLPACGRDRCLTARPARPCRSHRFVMIGLVGLEVGPAHPPGDRTGGQDGLCDPDLATAPAHARRRGRPLDPAAVGDVHRPVQPQHPPLGDHLRVGVASSGGDAGRGPADAGVLADLDPEFLGERSDDAGPPGRGAAGRADRQPLTAPRSRGQ